MPQNDETLAELNLRIHRAAHLIGRLSWMAVEAETLEKLLEEQYLALTGLAVEPFKFVRALRVLQEEGPVLRAPLDRLIDALLGEDMTWDLEESSVPRRA